MKLGSPQTAHLVDNERRFNVAFVSAGSNLWEGVHCDAGWPL